MSGLSVLTGFLTDSAERHTVVLHRRECLRSRLRTSTCASCIEVCPKRALSLTDGRIDLDEKRCSGCLLCYAVCPGEALMPRLDPAYAAQRIIDRGSAPVVSCVRQPRAVAGEIRVPCLGMFTTELLLYLGIAGGRKTIVFRAAACAFCENSRAFDSFSAALRRLERKARSCLNACFVVATAGEESNGAGNAERRLYMGALKDRLVEKLTQATSRGSKEQCRETGRKPTRKSRFVRQALAAAAPGERHLLQELCTFDLRRSPSCTPCLRCSGICPTGALRLSGTGDTRHLELNRLLCSGCGLCSSFCKTAALTLVKPPLHSS